MTLKTAYRTHSCGELTKEETNREVILCGWVHSIRSHGKLTFLDLRDRYGLTQVIINPKNIKKIAEIKLEYILKIKGKVKIRPPNTINKELKTGEIELEANNIELISKSETPPIEIEDRKEASDNLRLEYRYLDLRRPIMKNRLLIRHNIAQATREYFNQNGFIEVETPLLVKSTPEGARDYIVPSRVNPGKFYALPQSPQLYKQILMVSGFDRYYQLAHCLRDEDLRQDRQPEFTQIDLELSFIDREDLYAVMEGLMKHLFKKILNINIKTPFPRLSYEEAMKKYKTDKPDLRKNKKDTKEFAFCWITDFPLFEWNKEDNRWYSMHHPFTMPRDEDIKLLDKDPGKVKAKAYDLVLNGTEIAGGSIRIHIPEIQNKIFNLIGLTKKEAEEKFGFLLKAFKYSPPPHGGIAFGFDRLVALMQGLTDIREVIAFPKNKQAQGPMEGSPSEVSKEQLKELKIKLDK